MWSLQVFLLDDIAPSGPVSGTDIAETPRSGETLNKQVQDIGSEWVTESAPLQMAEDTSSEGTTPSSEQLRQLYSRQLISDSGKSCSDMICTSCLFRMYFNF